MLHELSVRPRFLKLLVSAVLSLCLGMVFTTSLALRVSRTEEPVIPTLVTASGDQGKTPSERSLAVAYVDAVSRCSGFGLYVKPVVVEASAGLDGSVIVDLRRIHSGRIGRSGRKETKPLIQVIYKQGGEVVLKPIGVRKVDNPRLPSRTTVGDLRTTAAATMALGNLLDSGYLTSPVEVNASTSATEITVTVWRIPYLPGGHTTILVSTDLWTMRVIGGEQIVPFG